MVKGHQSFDIAIHDLLVPLLEDVFELLSYVCHFIVYVFNILLSLLLADEKCRIELIYSLEGRF